MLSLYTYLYHFVQHPNFINTYSIYIDDIINLNLSHLLFNKPNLIITLRELLQMSMSHFVFFSFTYFMSDKDHDI
jgi:hypothetical protein